MAFLTTAGARLHYEDHPAGARTDEGRLFEAAVLIHGWACDASDWDPLLEPLAPLGRVVTVDLRGSGGSTATGHAYTVGALAADVGELLEHLELRQAVLVGHSAGGEVAAATAVLHPGGVRAVVGVDPAYGFPAEQRETIAEVARRLDDDPVAVAREYFARLDDNPATPGELARSHQASASRGRPEVLRRTFQDFAFGPGAFHFRPDTDGFIGRVPVPLLGVYRNETRAAVGHDLMSRAGDRVLTYPGAGHWPHQEQPDRFVADMKGWLEGLTG